MTAMYHMVNELMQSHCASEPKQVSRRDYEQWARGFVFDGLRNLSYGQSFCKRFDIQDNILYHTSLVADAERYIMENYVR